MEVKAGWFIPLVDARVHGWQVKLCDPSLTRAIPEQLSGELLSIMRYKNVLFTFTYLLHCYKFNPPPIKANALRVLLLYNRPLHAVDFYVGRRGLQRRC